MTLLLIAVGGMAGAVVGALLAARFDRKIGGFPFGTFAANMLASFLLGVIIALSAKNVLSFSEQIFLETGFCATLSTFSSMAWQLANMLKKGHPLLALIYAMSTFCCGMTLFLAAAHSFEYNI